MAGSDQRRTLFLLTGILLLAMVAIPVRAATLHVETPTGISATLSVSIYRLPRAGRPPDLRLTEGGIYDLPAGQYGLGIGDYPGTALEFDLPGGQGYTLQLAALTLSAPAGSARFAIFTGGSGELVSPADLPGTVLLPPGEYFLRRDLSTEHRQFRLRPGEHQLLEWGALAFSGCSTDASTRIRLRSTEDHVRLQYSGPLVPVPLPPGVWHLALEDSLRSFRFTIEAGRTRVVELQPVILAGRDGPTFELRADPDQGWTSWPPGEDGMRLIPAGLGGLRLRSGDRLVGSVEPAGTGPTILWRETGGRCPQIEGLSVIPKGGTDAVAIRGQSISLRVALLENGTTEIEALQGDHAPIHLATLTDAARRPEVAVPVPPQLPEGDVRFSVVHRLAGGRVIQGISRTVATHTDLETAPRNLVAARCSTTWIELAWEPPEPSRGVKGYNIYRGDSARPLNRGGKSSGTAWTDLGLSAGREYRYRVCPVDALGREGPAASAVFRTRQP